jgi:protease PrsW
MLPPMILAVIPGLLIAWLIFRADRHERESWFPLLVCFMLGMIVTVPVMFVQEWIHKLGADDPSSLIWALFSSFLVIALVEELFKFLVLVAFPYRQPFFNEPLDGIVYAMMIGMGFATLENLLYALEFGIPTVLLRGLTAVPTHAVCAVMMGYFVGKAKFKKDAKTSRKMLFSGLLLAFSVHGIYDFFIIQEIYDWLIGFSILTLLVSLVFALKMFKEEQQESEEMWRERHPETPAQDPVDKQDL